MSQATDMSRPSQADAPRRKLSRRKLWLFGLSAVLLSLGVGLLLLELLARLLVQNSFGTIEDLRRFEEVKRAGRQMTLIHLVRPRSSDSKRLIYELIPGIEGEFMGAPVRINDAGYFDPERTKDKSPGTFRIAALGDSVLFGWGVAMEERFSTLLETFLNDTATTLPATAAPLRFEVLNFGIPGYNTLMQAEVLRSHAAPYQPDALVLAFVPDNDSSLPNFIVKPKDRLSLRRSYLLELARSRGLGGVKERFRPELMGANPTDIPEEYRFLHGEEAMIQGLTEIRDHARETSAPLFLLPYFCNVDQLDAQGRVTSAAPPTKPEVAALGLQQAEELGYAVIDPRKKVGEYLGKKGLIWENLVLSRERGDTHPNAVHHALLAKELYRSMVEHGGVPDWVERRARLEEDLRRWDEIVEAAWKK